MMNLKRLSEIPKRNKASIFKTFLNESLHEQTIHKILQKEFSKSHEELLIDELKKPSSSNKDLVKFFRQYSQYSALYSQVKRNIELTIYLLQQLKPFYRFIKFNKVDLNDLKNIAINLKYNFYPKHSYIFSYRQYTKKFYGIIKGSVSMRRKITVQHHLNSNISIEAKKRHDSISEENFVSFDCEDDNDIDSSSISSLNTKQKKRMTNVPPSPNELRSQFEIEQCRFESGMCFGEWNLIDNTIHSSSAYCIEDTHVFYLTKEHFDVILSGPISQAVIESKTFLHECIPMLTQEDLNKVKPEYYDKGDVVYTQFSKAKECFVVYQGECELKHDPNAKTNEDIYERKNRMKITTIVDKGGISGLEAHNPNTNYEYNLIVSQDYTILYRFNTKELERRINIKAYLRKLKKEKNKLLASNNDTQYKRLTCNQTFNKSRFSDEENQKALKDIQGIRKIMINHHKDKDGNKLKVNMTEINYSRFKSLASVIKKRKSKNVNSFCSASLLLNKTNKELSRNILSTQTNSFSNNKIINNIIGKSRLSWSNMNIRSSLKSINKLSNQKARVSIKPSSDIQKAIRQISKLNIKQIVYNSGRYNIPLFHTNLSQ